MRNLRGLPITRSGCKDPKLNIFYSLVDGTEFIMRQPRKDDRGKQKLAWREMSENTKTRYRRVNVDKKIYDMNYRCKMPLYRGEIPGLMPLSMEVEDKVVGFADIIFKYGTEFQKFNIQPTEKACNASLGVIDKYQGMGIGTLYAATTNAIGRHYGMDYILGTTFQRDGMYNIRVRDGCEVIRIQNGLVDHKKYLK